MTQNGLDPTLLFVNGKGHTIVSRRAARLLLGEKHH